VGVEAGGSDEPSLPGVEYAAGPDGAERGARSTNPAMRSRSIATDATNARRRLIWGKGAMGSKGTPAVGRERCRRLTIT
jgi:hypothetical protein